MVAIVSWFMHLAKTIQRLNTLTWKFKHNILRTPYQSDGTVVNNSNELLQDWPEIRIDVLYAKIFDT